MPECADDSPRHASDVDLCRAHCAMQPACTHFVATNGDGSDMTTYQCTLFSDVPPTTGSGFGSCNY